MMQRVKIVSGGPRAAGAGWGLQLPVLLLALSISLVAVGCSSADPSAPNRPELWSRPIIGLIDHHIHSTTEMDGPRCPMYPSCSAYGRDAITRYSMLGLLLTVDRILFREWGRLYQNFMVAPSNLSHDLRYYDRVEDSIPGNRPSLYLEDFAP